MSEKKYVELDAVIKAFDDPRVEHYYGDVDPDSVISVIKAIPTADVRPVVLGEWIGTHDGFYYTYSCSECGHEALYKENTTDQVCSEFCPNCGADMRDDNG